MLTAEDSDRFLGRAGWLFGWMMHKAAHPHRTHAPALGSGLRDPLHKSAVARDANRGGNSRRTQSGDALEARTRFWLVATRPLTVDPDAIFVRDGRVWSSAGVTSGIDLTLALIEQDAGRKIAMEVARMLVV